MAELVAAKIRQKFDNHKVEDVAKTVREELEASGVEIKPGMSIAVASGSRGVANIALVVKTVCEYLKEKGAHPFVIPAMGSHGGATAEGQREILAGYGIVEEYVGAPIKSSLEVVELDGSNLESRVFMDKYAYEADGTIVINRIKVHTDFHGPTESGLLKMCVIGLGKHRQALETHSFGVRGLRDLIRPTAMEICRQGNVLLGIGLVENAYDETAIIKALKPEEFIEAEKKLLPISKELMPKLPVDQLDVLIVDRSGKNISGTGMDPNVIGRFVDRDHPEIDFGPPHIKNIIVDDLTPETHGNAIGIGFADYTTEKLFEKIDRAATYENTITSTFVDRAKIPIIAQNSKAAYGWAMRTSGRIAPEDARVIRIENTLHLTELYVSKSVYEEIKDRPDIELISDFVPMFQENGELTEF